MGRLDGTVAVVTGGARSLGRAFGEALAAEGAHIAIADISDGSETAAAIANAAGVRALSWRLDVSDGDSVSPDFFEGVEED